MYICFEGIDGSGTTTQCKLLTERLEKEGRGVLALHQPSDALLGKLIRRVLQKEETLPPTALQLLFCADRKEQEQQEVLPALENKKIVLSDRSHLSTVAYAALAAESDTFFELGTKLFRQPDLTFFLRIPVETALERIGARNEAREIFEKKELLETISQAYDTYLQRMPKKKVVMLDATESVEVLAEKIWKVLSQRLSL